LPRPTPAGGDEGGHGRPRGRPTGGPRGTVYDPFPRGPHTDQAGLGAFAFEFPHTPSAPHPIALVSGEAIARNSRTKAVSTETFNKHTFRLLNLSKDIRFQSDFRAEQNFGHRAFRVCSKSESEISKTQVLENPKTSQPQ